MQPRGPAQEEASRLLFSVQQHNLAATIVCRTTSINMSTWVLGQEGHAPMMSRGPCVRFLHGF